MKTNSYNPTEDFILDIFFAVIFALLFVGAAVSVFQGAWWHVATGIISLLFTGVFTAEAVDLYKNRL